MSNIEFQGAMADFKNMFPDIVSIENLWENIFLNIHI